MESKLKGITSEEEEIISKNLKNVNGTKPIRLIEILDKIVEALERGMYGGREIRDAALVLRHFGYPLFSLSPMWQSEVARAYPEMPKNVSERDIREMFK